MTDDNDLGASEPDNENDETLTKNDTAHANGMAKALNDAANMVKANGEQVKASQLTVDHPYGDGKHGETGHDTLKRLGAGSNYGQ